MFHAIWSVVTGGGENPLSVESTYAQILRVIQAGIFAGVLYLIKLLKDTKSNSSSTHNEIQSQIDDVRNIAQENFKANNDLIREVKSEIEALRKPGL